MDNENKKNETPKPGSDSANAQKSTMERGTEAIGQAEKVVTDAYDKTAQTVSETYEHAKSYGCENPGKTMLIALGIGVGLGILLVASSRHSRTSLFARPVVNALSDVALEFFR